VITGLSVVDAFNGMGVETLFRVTCLHFGDSSCGSAWLQIDLDGSDLCPKSPPALRGVLGVKSLALGGHFVHRLSLQKLHWRQVA
jgi:hypothetical protein